MGKAELMAPFFQSSLDSCGEIQEQVKPIGNLKRIRGTLLGSLGINATVIATDNLYAGVFFLTRL